MIEQLKTYIDDLTSLKEEIGKALPLLEHILSLRETVAALIEKLKTARDNESDDMLKNELRRLYCNIWAIDNLYLKKITGQPLAKTDEDIVRNITGWIDNLIFRLEKYGN